MIESQQASSIGGLAVKALSAGAGRWVAQVAALLFWPLALAYISAADFGVFSILQVVALVGGVVTSLGLNAVFIARFAESGAGSENLLGRILGLQVVLGGALTALLWLLSPSIAEAVGINQGAELLRLLLVSQYFGNLVLVFGRWQILANRHAQLSIVALLQSLSQIGLLALLVIWQHLGLLGVVCADLGGNLSACVAAAVLGRGRFKLELRQGDMRSVVTYGLPAMPDPIFYWLMVFLPLLSLKMNGLLALAGAFSLAWRLVSPIDLLGNSLASAAADRLVRSGEDQPGLGRWYQLSVVGIVLGALAILCFSPEILGVFFVSQYGLALSFMPFTAAAAMFLAFYYFEWIRVNGSGRTYALSLASGGGVVVVLVGLVLPRQVVPGSEVAFFFAAGFLAMWLIARSVSTGARHGRWDLLLAIVAACVVLGLVVVSTPRSPAATAIKALGLVALLLAAAIWETAAVAKPGLRGPLDRSQFVRIPNYAEVARNVGHTGAILDIGCSEGFFLSDIHTSGIKVGVDSDLARLSVGRRERRVVDFVCADASRLPFGSGRFDTVVLIGVLPYLEKPMFALGEAHRVLGTSGRIELSTASDQWLYRLLNVYSWKHRVRYYSGAEVETLLRDTGFIVKSVYSRGKLLTTLIGNVFPLSNLFDQLLSSSASVLGPSARRMRAMTNAVIQWEYDHHRGDGYQLFASGVRDG